MGLSRRLSTCLSVRVISTCLSTCLSERQMRVLCFSTLAHASRVRRRRNASSKVTAPPQRPRRRFNCRSSASVIGQSSRTNSSLTGSTAKLMPTISAPSSPYSSFTSPSSAFTSVLWTAFASGFDLQAVGMGGGRGASGGVGGGRGASGGVSSPPTKASARATEPRGCGG